MGHKDLKTSLQYLTSKYFGIKLVKGIFAFRYLLKITRFDVGIGMPKLSAMSRFCMQRTIPIIHANFSCIFTPNTASPQKILLPPLIGSLRIILS